MWHFQLWGYWQGHLLRAIILVRSIRHQCSVYGITMNVEGFLDHDIICVQGEGITIQKQQEMTTVIHEIYTALESQSHLGSTIFVVAGDHDMTQKGNHGGFSAGKISRVCSWLLLL